MPERKGQATVSLFSLFSDCMKYQFRPFLIAKMGELTLALLLPVFWAVQGERVAAAEVPLGDRLPETVELAEAAEVLPLVDRLADVQPTDWAFQALRSLVEKYQCVPANPSDFRNPAEQLFQGNQAISRYEFADILDQCLAKITTFSFEQIPQEDWDAVQRIQSDFQAELVTLNQRLDRLDLQTSELQSHQFSPTTRLQGDAVFSLDQLRGDTKPNGSGADLPENLAVGSRLRLNLDTSFTGKDLLKIRLDALNPVAFNTRTTGTNMTRLNFDRNTQNTLDIGKLFYRFPVNDRLQLQVDAIKGAYYANTLNTFNGSLASPTLGSVSRFGRFNPIYYQGFPGTGITAAYDLSDQLTLSLGYLAQENSAANADIGLFKGNYTALTQLEYQPNKTVQLGLTYAHSYYAVDGVAVAGGTGSRLANAPFGNLATSADHVGLETNLRLGAPATLSGWVGMTFADAETSGGSVVAGDRATLLNWAVTLGLPDLGGKGNYGGFILGQPPHVLSNTGGPEEQDSAWHLEALYRYRLNAHVALIPGLFVVINPENQADHDPIWVGSLRTVFQF